LARAAELAEYGLRIVSLEAFVAGPQNAAWARSMMGPGDLWLVIDAKGQAVAKGGALPAPAELAQALKKRGVLPAELYLKRFLKSRPDNQEARAALINLLHEKAVARTLKELDMAPAPEAGAGGEAAATATQWHGDASLKPASTDKVLDDKADLEIWGLFAQEIENLFSDPAWAAAPLALRGYLAEAHSRLAQAAYGRHLGKVQDALVSMPSNYQCWRLWVRLKSALPVRPLAAFLNGLRPLPQEFMEGRYLLDPQIVDLLLEDARAHGDWGYARELLLGHLDAEFPPDAPPQERSQNELLGRAYRSDTMGIFQNFMEPLIEALVSSGLERAVPDALRRFVGKRGDVSDLDLGAHLGGLAKRLGRDDLAPSWMGAVQ